MLSEKQLEAIEIAVGSKDGNTDVSDAIQGASSSQAAVAALSPIADPSSATAEDVATAYNALLAALQG